MGATRTFKYQYKDYREELSRMSKILKNMNAVELGQWSESISVLHHKNSEQSSNLYVLSHSNYQIAVVSNSKNRQIIQGDKNLHRLIESTQCFKTRQVYNIVGEGFQIGDFIFRIGIGSIGNDYRCLIMEVEFVGAIYISQALPSIKEFMSIIDPFEKYSIVEVNYSDYFLFNSEEFSPKISAIDTLICLNCLDL